MNFSRRHPTPIVVGVVFHICEDLFATIATLGGSKLIDLDDPTAPPEFMFELRNWSFVVFFYDAIIVAPVSKPDECLFALNDFLAERYDFLLGIYISLEFQVSKSMDPMKPQEVVPPFRPFESRTQTS